MRGAFEACSLPVQRQSQFLQSATAFDEGVYFRWTNDGAS